MVLSLSRKDDCGSGSGRGSGSSAKGDGASGRSELEDIIDQIENKQSEVEELVRKERTETNEDAKRLIKSNIVELENQIRELSRKANRIEREMVRAEEMARKGEGSSSLYRRSGEKGL